MDYEKKHKKTLEKVKSFFKRWEDVEEANTFLVLEELKDIFPELKESEDERIRKWIIDDIRYNMNNEPLNNSEYKKKAEKAISWLEKQGTSYTKKDVDDAYLKGISDTKNEIEKQYEATYQIRKDIATFIFNYRGGIKDRAKWMNYLGVKAYFFDKQDEKSQGKTALEAANEEKVDNRNCVKSDDEIKRKFEIGDWICNGGGNPCKVNYIFGNYYELCSIGGYKYNKPISDIDANYHLWSIEDAKDGDVLCYKDEISLFEHGIKNCTEQGTTFGGFVYHCCYDGKSFITDSLYSLTEQDKIDIHPATKEQRELLFKKMNDAWYEWDDENKILMSM